MKKNSLKKFLLSLSAAVICLTASALKSDADTLALDQYYVGYYYVVNTDGVYSCQETDYLYGYNEQYYGAYHFSKGDVLYVSVCAYCDSGYTAGTSWGSCSDSEEETAWYGWIDMRYLTPYNEYFEPVHYDEEPVTTPQTTPHTKPAETTAKQNTYTTAVRKTDSYKTTTRSTYTTAAKSNDDESNFFKDNEGILIIGGIIVFVLIIVGDSNKNNNKNKNKK